MNKRESSRIVEETFSKSFDENQFHKFIRNLLNDYRVVDKSVAGDYIRHAFHDFVLKYKIHGEYTDPEGKRIHILQVILKQGSTLLKARTAQRNFVADYLKQRNLDSALVAFIAPKEDDWRFSLVKLEYSLTSDKGKIRSKETLTPAKRWSFLVGRNEGIHTAQSRFANILADSQNPTLRELEKAFDVEKVTNEFFEKYKDLYFRFKESLDKIILSNPQLQSDFDSKDINSADFSKKTLGQIVFLYFLQKKGWFGVAHDKNWGEGPKQFIRALFDKRRTYGKNFFNDILEPLFYEALATDRGSKSIYPRLNNTRMPFLNGGLFEPINDYNWEITKINIPDELFSNTNKTKEGDIGDGILDVFDRYNFTVNENDPLEKEVAVDPEMLGKVFENLLEIKERKDKGSFYTPREIVHYMCRESLINYLETETNNEIPHSDLEILIYKGINIIENDSLVLSKIKEKTTKGFSYTGSLKLMLPKSIQENAKRLDQLLKDIKIADPAVGSGAFPLGMITEIVNARKTLGIYTNSIEDTYTIKLHAISNSIHGVDIDPGAVEIAKLRLWLSLVVEESEPHPLPNLDHRIMQGNSLLSEYEGIKLFDPSFLNDQNTSQEEIERTDLKISQLQKVYFSLHQHGKIDVVRKNQIETQIKNLRRKQSLLKSKEIKEDMNKSLFDRNDKFDEIEYKTNLLQQKIEDFVSESRKTNKEELKAEIDNLKWELIEESLSQQGKNEKLEEVKEFKNKNVRPFFLWQLEFSEVFRVKNGFDIVIGNPPYGFRNVLTKEEKKHFRKIEKIDFSSGDAAELFCRKSFDELVANKGILSFIIPKKCTYGESWGGWRLNYLLNYDLEFVLDAGKAFDRVLLEQTAFGLAKADQDGDVKLFALDSKIDKINILGEAYKTKIFKDNHTLQMSLALFPESILSKIQLNTDKKSSVSGDLGLGIGIEFFSDVKTEDKLLKGIDIGRWIVKKNRYLKNKSKLNWETAVKFLRPKVLAQVLIAHIENPNPHIKITACYDKEGIIITNTLTAFSHINNLNEFFLLGYLNSKLLNWYAYNFIYNRSIRTMHLYSYYIEQIPIPLISTTHQNDVANLVRKIIEAKQSALVKSQEIENEIKMLENQIDQVIYQVFGLTDAEKSIVESGIYNLS